MLLPKIINVALSTNTLFRKLGLYRISRPVSNLSFLSKILQKVVFKQLIECIIVNNLRQKFQSAYRMFHIKNILCLRVFNDLIDALDKENVCVEKHLSAFLDLYGFSVVLRYWNFNWIFLYCFRF